jgi:Fe-S-cluster containining protein
MAARRDDSKREWFEEGLAFSCTQCGNCCTGPPGAVWFTDEEELAMAAALSLDLETFRDRYVRRLGRSRSLVERETDFGHDCVFLDRESQPGKAVCSIYKARPRQCRTWPWWPENLASRRAWEATRRRTPCPGMGQGTVHSPQQIRIVRDEQAAQGDPAW